MAINETITVEVRGVDAPKAETYSLQLRQWTPADGKARGLKWGGAMLGVAAVMLPIPIVHFGAIPVVLFGAPLVFFVVNRVYSSGTDLVGTIACPHCQAPQELQTSVTHWPIQRLCLSCRKSFSIARATPAAKSP